MPTATYPHVGFSQGSGQTSFIERKVINWDEAFCRKVSSQNPALRLAERLGNLKIAKLTKRI